MNKQQLLIFCWFVLFSQSFLLLAQGPMPVGVDSVVVVFDNPPGQWTVEKAPLKYNKDFAFSFQMDDALDPTYDIAFPALEGSNETGGMYYTNGCGDSITFKMSSAISIFSNYAGDDVLEPDLDPENEYVDWNELKTLYQAGWGIINHGAFINPGGTEDYMVQRTQGYARRKISDSLLMKTFVIPSGNLSLVDNVFGNNYHNVIDKAGENDWLENNVDVELDNIDWLDPIKLRRYFVEDEQTLQAAADTLFQRSLSGKHYWIPWGMHDEFQTFAADFSYVYNTYGSQDRDNVLITTEDDIVDYLVVKQETQVSESWTGNKLTLTFSGSIPADRLHYDLSLNVQADQTISSIDVYGADNHSYNGVGNDTALINLSWEGRYYYPMEFLADSFATVATSSETEWDCLVAMDYVILMDSGSVKDSLRDLLCSINQSGWLYGYEDGFCDSIMVDLGDDISLCADSCINLTNLSAQAGEYTYLWSTGETDSAITICPVSDTTIIWLTAYDDFGFSATDTMLISNATMPEVSLAFSSDIICVGELVTATAEPADQAIYEWTYNGQMVNTGDTATYTFAPAVSDSLLLKVTSQEGCSDTASKFLMVNPLPVVDLGVNDSICLGDSIQLSAPSAPDGDTYTYLWNEGSTSQSIWVHVDVSGTFEYSVVVTDINGCEGSDNILITVLNNPDAILSFSSNPICADESDTAFALPANQAAYFWTYDGQTVPTGDTAYHTFVADSSMWVYLEVISPDGCSGVDSHFLVVHPLPVVNLGAGTSICLGDSVLLSPTVIPAGDTYTYLWNDGSTSQSIWAQPDMDSTTFIYYVSATNMVGCVGSDTTSIEVWDQPEVILSLSYDTICAGDTVTAFALPANQAGYFWTYDGQTTSTGNTAYHTFVPNSSMLVSLEVISPDGCSGVDSLFLLVNPLPEVDLGPDITVNLGETDTLSGPSGPYHYAWYVADTLYVTTQIIVVSPADTTAYVLTVTDTLTGCQGSDTININIIFLTVNLGDTVNICSGDCDTIFGPAGSYMYFWFQIADPDTLIGTLPYLEVCPESTSSYYLVVWDVGNNIMARDTITYIVLPTPVVDLGPDTSILLGDTVTLSGPGGDYSYQWFENGNPYSNDSVIFVSPADTTAYALTVTDTVSFCEGSDTINIDIIFLTVSLGEDSTICQGSCVRLEGPPDMASYQWYVDSTVFDTSQMVVVCPMDTSIYSLVVTDSLGNQAGDSIRINVLPAPQVDLGEDAAFCLGDSLYLSAPSAPEGETYTYMWNEGDTTQNIWVYPHVSDSTFVYYVDVTSDLNACVGTDTVYVTAWFQPDAILSVSDSSICMGNTITANAFPIGQGAYKWTYNGQTLTSGFINSWPITPAYSQWISVEVIAPLQSGGCSDTDSLYVEVTPPPAIMVTNDTSICVGDSVSLIASGGDLYEWYAGGTLIGTDATIKVTPSTMTSYVVMVSRLNGCSNSDTVVVDLYPNPAPSITYDSTALCMYAEVMLQATGADTYLWMPAQDTAETLSVILYDTTTIYLIGFSPEGCKAVDNVLLLPLPPPEVYLTGLLPAYCINDPFIHLYGSPLGGAYTGPGVMDSLFYPELAGEGVHEIIYSFTNASSCTGYDTIPTIVYVGGPPIHLGSDTSMPLNGSIELNAGSGFDRVYWSTGDTSRQIVLHDGDRPPGTYVISVAGVKNGCTSEGSIQITFLSPDGLSEYQTNLLHIYPNPNNGHFTIVFDKPEKNLLLTLFDMQGREIFRREHLSCNPECLVEIAIPDLKPGIYYVRVAAAHYQYSSKLMIR